MLDPGLLVLDNKEQGNFEQPLIDYCLFLATGAERGRSDTQGAVRRSSSRPVAVITSIEGVWKQELQKRCIEVEYAVSGQALGRDEIEQEICRRRDEMYAGIVSVLTQYFKNLASQDLATPDCPIPHLQEYFLALCNLLRAYGDVTGRPRNWSDRIAAAWSSALSSKEPDENELEAPILQLTNQALRGGEETVVSHCLGGVSGHIWITQCGELLTRLKTDNRDRKLPENATGLGRRLSSAKFKSFSFVNDETCPDVPKLRRTSRRRPIGFFLADDDMSGDDK